MSEQANYKHHPSCFRLFIITISNTIDHLGSFHLHRDVNPV